LPEALEKFKIMEAIKMGMYSHIRDLWKKPQENMPELWRARLIQWRKEPSTVRLDKPTRIDRARSLGYKAKQGFIIVRERVIRGGHSRGSYLGGRRPKHARTKMVLTKNYQQIAEERVNDKYPNCEVLSSYWVAEDGRYYWYEVILVDVSHPVILADPDISWIAEKQHTGRVYRGLTSAGRKSRALRRKGKGAEKIRPSRTANIKRRKGWLRA
jgi:large subunit ribosomal protein L15e